VVDQIFAFQRNPNPHPTTQVQFHSASLEQRFRMRTPTRTVEHVRGLSSIRSDIYELFRNQSRLTANRNLRVAKLIQHVWRSIFVLRCAKVFVCARSRTNSNLYRDRAHDQKRTIILSHLAHERRTCMRSSVMTRCFHLG